MKMRKIIAYILVLVMLMGLLAGCGKSKDSTKTTKPKNKETEGTEYLEETETGKATEGSKPTTATNPTVTTKPTEPIQTQPTNPPSEPDCNHNPKEWIMAATCTSEGARMQRCEQCGYILSSEKIDKLPHDNEWVTEEEATCQKFGLKYQQCKDCKAIFVYIQTEKADHTPDITGLKCKHCDTFLLAN